MINGGTIGFKSEGKIPESSLRQYYTLILEFLRTALLCFGDTSSDVSNGESQSSPYPQIVLYFVVSEEEIKFFSKSWFANYLLLLSNLERQKEDNEDLSSGNRKVIVQLLPESLLRNSYLPSSSYAEDVFRNIAFSLYSKCGYQPTPCILKSGVSHSSFRPCYVVQTATSNSYSDRVVSTIHVSFRVIELVQPQLVNILGRNLNASKIIISSGVDSQGEAHHHSILAFTSDARWEEIVEEIWLGTAQPILTRWRSEKSDDIIQQVVLTKIGEMSLLELNGKKKLHRNVLKFTSSLGIFL